LEKRRRRNLVEEEFLRKYQGKQIKLIWSNVLQEVENNNLQLPLNCLSFDPNGVIDAVITSAPKSKKKALFGLRLLSGDILKDVPSKLVVVATENVVAERNNQELPGGLPSPSLDQLPSLSQISLPSLSQASLSQILPTPSTPTPTPSTPTPTPSTPTPFPTSRASTPTPTPIPISTSNTFHSLVLEAIQEEETEANDVANLSDISDGVDDLTDDENDSDPLRLAQIEALVPDEDLEELNHEIHHPVPATEMSLSTLVSDVGLASLNWRVGETIPTNEPTLFPNEPRITSAAVIQASRPIDIFFTLWPMTLWTTMAEETDRYRRQNNWNQIKPITTQDIICYSGLLIARSLHPWASGLRNHWRSTSEGPFEPGTFGMYMSRNRYSEIARCLHFADNEYLTEDRFYKVNVFVDTLNKTFSSVYSLGRNISFDEGTIKATGRRVPAKTIQ
jgi:hypothetical protein